MVDPIATARGLTTVAAKRAWREGPESGALSADTARPAKLAAAAAATRSRFAPMTYHLRF
jgi:hypothetical protein